MPSQAEPTCEQIPGAAASEAQTDEQIMTRVQAGDKTAFAILYDRHAPTIYALCLKIVRMDSDAEAVVSDVFLEVWRNPWKFDDRRGSCRTYLLTLARSRAIDRWRATGTRNRRTQDAGEQRVDSDSELQLAWEPSSLAEQSERRQAVRGAIATLDASQRQTLILAYFEGLTHREIAERLEMPLGTVKTKIRNGIGALRKTLAKLGDSSGL
ncbi:MAG: sigma-70 family RNA polymerase sigma factor [Planctomycetota bacterium]